MQGYPLEALRIVVILAGFWIIKRVDDGIRSYAVEKAKNLATKEDIDAITRKVEAVKDEVALMARRREMTSEVVDFINAYKQTPQGAADVDLLALEKAYYKLAVWVPSEVLTGLNALVSVKAHEKPDVKDLVIAARRAILGEAAAGTFTGADLVHFVGFRK